MSNQTTTGGIGFPGLLTILFIGLKLMGVISWSWWWVLAPLWVTGLLVIVVVVALAALAPKGMK
jgi:hypothetical protein